LLQPFSRRLAWDHAAIERKEKTVPSYELVASRSVVVDGPLKIGDTFPSDNGGVWRVIRIEKADTLIYSGEKVEQIDRAICVVE
jgi:hypothetical protein